MYFNDTIKKNSNLVSSKPLHYNIYDRIINQNKNAIIVVNGGTGCQPKGSKVLMANGNWKNIEDIVTGDIVLSPQLDKKNKFCRVLKTTKWFSEENYDIIKLNRDKSKLYSCSSNHLLPVYNCKYPRVNGTRPSKLKQWGIKNYRADKFSNMSNRAKSHNNIGMTMFQIDKFKDRKECEIEPYTLGFFLGDGHFSDYYKPIINKKYDTQKRRDKQYFHNKKKMYLNITTMDIAVMEEISKFYPVKSIQYKKNSKANTYSFSINSKLYSQLKAVGLANKKSGEKFVPKEALFSNMMYRKRFLAGLIDSDGYYSGGGYEITTKSEQLAKDILFLVYSLGGRGRIRKKIGKIKSIDFIGEYFDIAFYLKDIKLELKCDRKIKKITSVYKDSNRIAINAVKNDKKNMVYGFTLESESGLYITDNYMITHNSGKSWACLRLACDLSEHFGSTFSLEENMAFNFKDMLKNIDKHKDTKGKVYIMEEIGAMGSGGAAMEWQSKNNRGFFTYLQIGRCKNQVIILNCPSFSYLQKGARELAHYQLSSMGVNQTQNQSYFKPLKIQVNERSGKMYFKYLKYADPFGDKHKFKRITFGKPADAIITRYEHYKNTYVDGKIKDLINIDTQKNAKLDKIFDKHTVINRLHDAGHSGRKIAEYMGMALSSIQSAVKKFQKNPPFDRTAPPALI